MAALGWLAAIASNPGAAIGEAPEGCPVKLARLLDKSSFSGNRSSLDSSDKLRLLQHMGIGRTVLLPSPDADNTFMTDSSFAGQLPSCPRVVEEQGYV